jgi:hypothetical protein
MDAALDLRLVNIVCKGQGLKAAAGECRVTLDQALARWNALTPDKGMDWQSKLNRALRQRANPAT